jgi:hypothetical protein
MIRTCLKFIKESGLLGSLIASIIIALISIIIPYLKLYFHFLNKEIHFSLTLSAIISISLLLIGITFFSFSLITNVTRKVGQFIGYYRKYLYVNFFPYLKTADGKIFTRREWIMEFTIFRDGITNIGPYTYYAYKPRSADGEEVIYNFYHEAKLNGATANILWEENDIGKDGKNILLRSRTPFKAGDNIYLKLQYDVFGENALCQEDLDNYLSTPDLKDVLRNRLIKKMNCEAVFYNPAFAKHYQVKVIFPEYYPWKPLDNLENHVDIVLGLVTLSKERIRRIIEIIIDPNCITIKYNHKFPPTKHWTFIYWKLPIKAELIF